MGYDCTDSENKFRRSANYLAPQYKGIHLGDLHQVKTDIKLLFAFKDLPNVTSTSDDQLEESDIPLYPISKLKQKFKSQKTQRPEQSE